MSIEEAPVLSLEQIEEAAAFTGFEPDDFAVFAIPGFAARMPELRRRITPKLKQIGEALAPRLAAVFGETVYPHVAQHLRRTVNAPEETWVAFAREKRAYKPFVHLRVTIQAEQTRILVFCEDYADDKARFAANLARNADSLSAYFTHHPVIQSFELRDAEGAFLRGSALDADSLRHLADRLQRIKGQHAHFGLTFADSHPVLADGPEFLDAVEEAARTLKPLYDCGAGDEFIYTYEPEVIKGI